MIVQRRKREGLSETIITVMMMMMDDPSSVAWTTD